MRAPRLALVSLCIVSACDGKELACGSGGETVHVALPFPAEATLRCADPSCDAIVPQQAFVPHATTVLALGSRFAPETLAGTHVEVIPSDAAEVDGLVVEPTSAGQSTVLVWAGDQLETWIDLDVVRPTYLHVIDSRGEVRLSLSKQPSLRMRIGAVDEMRGELESYLPADVTFDSPGIARVELRPEGRFVVAEAVGSTSASLRAGPAAGRVDVKVEP